MRKLDKTIDCYHSNITQAAARDEGRVYIIIYNIIRYPVYAHHIYRYELRPADQGGLHRVIESLCASSAEKQILKEKEMPDRPGTSEFKSLGTCRTRASIWSPSHPNTTTESAFSCI